MLQDVAPYAPNAESRLIRGETAADVAANVAAAINADLDLAALGVTAVALGGQVATTGELTAFDVNDPGLVAPRVPALSGGGRWFLGAVLVLVALLPLSWRRVVDRDASGC